jgi:hypothetical protein
VHTREDLRESREALETAKRTAIAEKDASMAALRTVESAQREAVAEGERLTSELAGGWVGADDVWRVVT